MIEMNGKCKRHSWITTEGDIGTTYCEVCGITYEENQKIKTRKGGNRDDTKIQSMA